MIKGALEIDCERGVIYFHAEESGTTILRVCRLPKPIPEDVTAIDITHNVGVSYTTS